MNPERPVAHEYMTIDRFNDEPGFADTFYGRLLTIVRLAAKVPADDLLDELGVPLWETFSNIIEGECVEVSMQQAEGLMRRLAVVAEQHPAARRVRAG